MLLYNMKKLLCLDANKTLLTEKGSDNLFPDDCNEPLIMKVLQHISLCSPRLMPHT